MEVIYMGCLKVDIETPHQDVVAANLFDNFNCVATFLNSDLRTKSYHNFCNSNYGLSFTTTCPSLQLMAAGANLICGELMPMSTNHGLIALSLWCSLLTDLRSGSLSLLSPSPYMSGSLLRGAWILAVEGRESHSCAGAGNERGLWGR
ncbi:hypothetical protein O6H91_02G104800 [Diphasiastrum complanatum]|uniref:Uncharacterized protein n=1 Tax=Diphasiastrum complanatum TaxID=34168 RepID=A0ACC2EJ01_DIPCM|nr:hypothetical protein O6H91_02G104800 [Diphasiastrum complanatum]